MTNKLPEGILNGMPPLSSNAQTVLEKRYLDRDETGAVHETCDELFWRVASYVATHGFYRAASEQSKLRVAMANFRLMRSGKFLPNSPTLANAGIRTGQLSACFVLPVSDAFSNSKDGIYDTLTKAQLIQQTGGGVGFSFSRLRRKDALVKTTKGVASGPISFMRVYDVACEQMKQGGVRRGAQMGILRVDHPDILMFADSKLDLTQLTNFNISIGVTDAFLTALEHNMDYQLVDPAEGPVGFLSARLVWDKVIKNAWQSGEPGVVFLDRMERHNPTPLLGGYEASNPCGEQPLNPYESCNLGSINLELFVAYGDDNKPYIDDDALKSAVWDAIYMMDDIVDANLYVPAVPEIRETTLKTRKLGLGIMGAARMLFKLGLGYHTEEGRKAVAQVFAFIDAQSKLASVALAKDRGMFPYMTENREEVEKFYVRDWVERSVKAREQGFDEVAEFYLDARDKMLKHGIRNSTTTTIAPTGTISMVADTSGGCEPAFALAFKRWQADTHMVETDKAFAAALQAYGFGATEADLVLQGISENDGSLLNYLRGGIHNVVLQAHQHEALDKLAEVYVVAGDIKPEDHVRMQAALQVYCDAAISKCLAVGTLIPTSRGLVRVEDFSDNQQDDSFVTLDGSLTTGGHRILSHYRAGMKPATRIRLDNGATLVGATESHRVMTDKGWKLMSTLQPGDIVLGRLEASHGKGGLPLPKSGEFRTNSNRLQIPSHMTPAFAEFLGMVAADGHTTEATGFVGISCKDDEVEANFKRVVSGVFGVEPNRTVDNRNGVVTLYLTSRVLCRLVEELIGKGAYDKFVPDQILQGSEAEKLMFLRGVTLDGYVHGDGSLVVYAGMSEQLAYHVSELCRSFGLPKVSVDTKAVLGASVEGAKCYGVRVSNELQGLIKPIESHKLVEPVYVDYKVFVHPGTIQETREAFALSAVSSRENPNYSAVRSMQQRGSTYCFKSTAEKLGWSTDTLAYQVTEVSDAGMVEMYDIEVEHAHEYVVNGMVSHNTVNFPETATVEDVRKVYDLAVQLGCKGVTIYRNNSRSNQPLSVGTTVVEASKTELDPTQCPNCHGQDLMGFGLYAGKQEGMAVARQPRTRPERLFGLSDKIDTAEGKLYVQINYDKLGIREVIANLGKGGGVLASLVEGLSRVISVALQHHTPVADIAHIMRGIRGGNPHGFGPKQTLSIPDAIAQVLAAAPARLLVTPDETSVDPADVHPSTAGWVGTDNVETAELLGMLPISEEVLAPGASKVIKHVDPVRDLGKSPECPECGNRLVFEEGCSKCFSCGSSKCG